MKKSNFNCMVMACAFIVSASMQAQPKAFPTAEGFGQNATGGRGGKVVEVTNLDDNPTTPSEGSLRWALAQYPGEPLTVVFRVSGIINLAGAKAGELRCKRDNWTIAGQTAPGDGICIMGNKVNFGGSNNLVIRHLRFRIGTMIDPVTGEPDASGKGSIGIENASNWIIDHCTFGWSGEENMTIYDNVNTTIQWCIVHEGLYRSGHGKGDRGYGCQWGGQNATFHHNLLAHNYNRSSRLNGARSNDDNVLIDYVNNVNYNWGKANSCYGSDIERTSNRTNFVNNYYKPGPARPGTSSSYFTQSSVSSNQTPGAVAQWYMSGNYMEGTANVDRNTDNYTGLDASAYTSKGVSKEALISATPFEIACPVTTETAQEAFESVLAGAGAFPRDAVDARIVHETRTGTATGSGVLGANKGIIDTPDAVGGYPEYITRTVPADTDHDGMPDTWETANSLNPSDPEDRNSIAASGYTMLEEYLNDLAAKRLSGYIEEDGDTTPIERVKSSPVNISMQNNQLHIAAGSATIVSVKIYSVLGHTAKEKTKGDLSVIDLSGLAAGFYVAEAKVVGHEKVVFKFKVAK